MKINLEERLYPRSIRKHSPFTSNRYNEDKHFPTHLEILKFRKALREQEHAFNNELVKHNFLNFNSDLKKIARLDELVKHVLTGINSKEASKEKFADNVDNIAQIRIHREDYDSNVLRSPVSLLNEYSSTLKSSIFILDALKLTDDYFITMKNHFQEQLREITTVKDDVKTKYLIRAEFEGIVKKHIEFARECQPNGHYKYNHKKKITSFSGKFLSMHHLTAVEQVSETVKSYKDTLTDINFNFLGLGISGSELATALAREIPKHIPKSWNLSDEDQVIVKAIVNAEQKGFTNFTTDTTYTISLGNESLEKQITTKGNSTSLPFQSAVYAKNAGYLERRMESLVKTMEEYNHVFEDLRALINHSYVAKHLLSKGFNWAKQSKTGNETFVAKNMRYPYLALLGKHVVPNDVFITPEKNVHASTGATLGGKSMYGAGIVQNYVLSQASLPVACEELIYTPRENIISVIGDYDANSDTGDSRHSADLNKIDTAISHIKKYSLVVIDEVGLGIDPEEGGNLAGRLWNFLAEKKSIAAYIATHFKDKVLELANNHSSVFPIAFNYDGNKEPTFKAEFGKIATTSEGEVLAAKYHLDDEGFKAREKEFKDKGLV